MNNKYREFFNTDEVNNWVDKNYTKWLEKIKIERYHMENNDIGNLLYGYCGNLSELYNKILRGFSVKCEDDKLKEVLNRIEIINNEILKHRLNENIIVYRATYKNLLKCFNAGKKVKSGDTFVDKAFVSTSLLLDCAIEFSSSYKCDSILKLYLPKGIPGVYIKFDYKLSKLEESEFLLPKGCTFVVKKKYFNFKYWKTIYECDVILSK